MAITPLLFTVVFPAKMKTISAQSLELTAGVNRAVAASCSKSCAATILGVSLPCFTRCQTGVPQQLDVFFSSTRVFFNVPVYTSCVPQMQV